MANFKIACSLLAVVFLSGRVQSQSRLPDFAAKDFEELSSDQQFVASAWLTSLRKALTVRKVNGGEETLSQSFLGQPLTAWTDFKAASQIRLLKTPEASAAKLQLQKHITDIERGIAKLKQSVNLVGGELSNAIHAVIKNQEYMVTELRKWLVKLDLQEGFDEYFDEEKHPEIREQLESLFPELDDYMVTLSEAPSNCLGHALGLGEPRNLLPTVAFPDPRTDDWASLVDLVFGSVYDWLDGGMMGQGFGPRAPFAEQTIYPEGTVLIYENDISSVISVVNLLPQGTVEIAGPTHAAVLNEFGVWESKAGGGRRPIIHHLQPDALSGEVYGEPKYVYTPN